MLLQTLSGPVAQLNGAADGNDLELINSLSNPPLIPLTADDVYIRRCRLAGDAVDSQHGCFRSEDLERLLVLTHGAPALIGHNRNTLAVARFFGGSVEEHNGYRYIVPKFYWPKQHSAAEDFRVLLDSGIIAAASISFTFDKPTSSICGKDIRECNHQPGQNYGDKLCFYLYDGIDRVLEGSFVYRGAEPGTGILAENFIPPQNAPMNTRKIKKTITVRFNGRTYQALMPI
jgi:hypothetical protein